MRDNCCPVTCTTTVVLSHARQLLSCTTHDNCPVIRMIIILSHGGQLLSCHMHDNCCPVVSHAQLLSSHMHNCCPVTCTYPYEPTFERRMRHGYSHETKGCKDIKFYRICLDLFRNIKNILAQDNMLMIGG